MPGTPLTTHRRFRRSALALIAATLVATVPATSWAADDGTTTTTTTTTVPASTTTAPPTTVPTTESTTTTPDTATTTTGVESTQTTDTGEVSVVETTSSEPVDVTIDATPTLLAADVPAEPTTTTSTTTTIPPTTTTAPVANAPLPPATCRVYVAIRLNSRGSAVDCVERRLVQLGYWLVGPDGNFDATAVNALKAFQTKVGLVPASGVADYTTLNRLGIWTPPPTYSSATCTASYSVRLGSVGAPARCVETRLRQMGYWLVGPDDTFDQTAVNALAIFQGRQGWSPSGVADYTTLVRLGVWASPRQLPTPTCRVHLSVRLDTTGADARCVESRLVQLGYWLAGPNTTFDATAVHALKVFQYRYGLRSDGVAGVVTLSRLGIYDPTPPPNPYPVPANSGSGRRVVYSRSQQRIWAIDGNGNVVKTHRVSGRTYEPYRGTYSVYSRSLYTYAVHNPAIRWRYMVRFTYGPDGGRIGFHEIPNRNGVPLQSYQQLGLPLSGGCVRQSTPDARWMWAWAGIGTKVVVL